MSWRSADNALGIIKLGAANSRSVSFALHRAGADSFFIDRPEQIARACALVIPGVAHLGFMIDAIDRRGLRGPLTAAIRSGVPTLGICAGFQLLFTASEEAPMLKGLDIFHGIVTRLHAQKVPHIGWNRVEALLPALGSGWAYFAHSFAASSTVPDTAAVTEHGTPFASVARKGRVLGVQFHPERSGWYGRELLKQFVAGTLECARAG